LIVGTHPIKGEFTDNSIISQALVSGTVLETLGCFGCNLVTLRVEPVVLYVERLSQVFDWGEEIGRAYKEQPGEIGTLCLICKK
jgi:hypothetical protein